jgi:hypothetical protein
MKKINKVSIGILLALLLVIGVVSAAAPSNTYLSDSISWFKDKVGIGTNTPTEMLDVVGNIAVSGTVDGVDVSIVGGYLDQGVKTTDSVIFNEIENNDKYILASSSRMENLEKELFKINAKAMCAPVSSANAYSWQGGNGINNCSDWCSSTSLNGFRDGSCLGSALITRSTNDRIAANDNYLYPEGYGCDNIAINTTYGNDWLYSDVAPSGSITMCCCGSDS